MENNKLNDQELQEFMAYKEEKKKMEAKQRKRDTRETYKKLIDEQINGVFPVLQELSGDLSKVKRWVIDSFRQAIELKKELYETATDQYSHSFTNSESNKRITIGVYMTDDYRDTVNEGISLVKEAIASYARDKETEALVSAVLKLLSKDQKGNLKAGRVLQLQQIAEKLGNPKLIEGVRVIQESYQPAISKTYIRAEYKDAQGQWVSVPLGITES